jgi:hypothetical protein
MLAWKHWVLCTLSNIWPVPLGFCIFFSFVSLFSCYYLVHNSHTLQLEIFVVFQTLVLPFKVFCSFNHIVYFLWNFIFVNSTFNGYCCCILHKKTLLGWCFFLKTLYLQAQTLWVVINKNHNIFNVMPSSCFLHSIKIFLLASFSNFNYFHTSPFHFFPLKLVIIVFIELLFVIRACWCVCF